MKDTPVDAIGMFVAGIGPRPQSWEGKDGQHPINFPRPRYRPKEEALGYPLITHSNPAAVTGIALDIDDAGARTLWSDRGLPPPNLIMINRQSGRGHYWFQFEAQVMRHTKAYLDKHPPSKAWRFYEAVLKGTRAAYSCDPSYNGEMVKNPVHPKWETIVARERPYSLGDLYRHPGIKKFMNKLPSRVAEDTRGRNCSIFKSTMQWAVRNFRRYPDFVSLEGAIHSEALIIQDRLKHPAGPLLDRELRGIVQSVVRRIRDGRFYKGDGRNRGAAQLDPALDIATKQRLGQAYASQLRTARTLERLLVAHHDLRAKVLHDRDGSVCGVSMKALSTKAQVSLATAYRYRDDLQRILSSESNTSSLRFHSSTLTPRHSPLEGPPKAITRLEGISSNSQGLGHHLLPPSENISGPVDDPMRARESQEMFAAILRGEIKKLEPC